MTNKTNQRLKSVGDISISFDNLSQLEKFKVSVKKQLNTSSQNETYETQDTSNTKLQSFKQHNQAPKKQANSSKNEKIQIPSKSVAEKSKLQKPLTAQEKLQLERRDAQKQYLKELQLLTSDHCPKRHPFDLGYLELNEIKSLFPEFQKDSKHKGLDIKKLRNIFQKYLNLWKPSDQDLLDQLIDKLDRKNQNKITWDEFLRYLDQEGGRRNMVNEALLYGMGAKRLKEVNRINLKEAKEKDTYINTCLYMNFGPNFSFILTLDEKNKAKIYDSKQFNLIQELLYPSNYSEPKAVSKFRISNHTTLDHQLAQNFENIEQDRGLTNPYNSNSASVYSGKNSRVDLKNDYKKSKEQINFNKTRGSTFSAKVSELNEEFVSNTDTQSQLTNQFNIKIAKSQQKDKIEGSPQKKIEKAYENQTTQKKVEKIQENQQKNKQIKSNSSRIISANSQNKFIDGMMKNLETIVEEKVNSKEIRTHTRSRDQILSSTDTNGQYLQQNPYNLDLAPLQSDNQRQKKTRQYLFQKYGKRKLSSSKSKFEVLGVTSLEEKEGSRANLMTKDQETDVTGYNIRFLMPNLRVQHKEAKEKFDQKVQDVESQILKSKQKLIQLENVSSVKQKNPRRMITGTMSNNSAYETSSFDSRTQPEQTFQRVPNKNKNKSSHEILTKAEQNQILQEQKIEKILTKKNIVAYNMNQLAIKMEKQDEKLKDLQETNKYFYRQTSSTPFQIAQAQYMKQQMEKKGIDTMNSILVAQELTKMGQRADQKTIRDITGQMPDSAEESKNFCNTDMIMKYVDKIQTKMKNQERQEHDQVKKKQANHFKSVYALCATYNQELSILAIALIDRQVKIYKIKQNGALCQFVDYLSFYSKYYITCMFIERSVQNSKPILVMGSKSGEIEIYYFEDSKNKEQPNVKQHECSPFNFFYPKATINQKSKSFQKKQESKLFQDKIIDESVQNDLSFDNQVQNIQKIQEKINNSQIFDRIILEETIQDVESSLNQDILEKDNSQPQEQLIQIKKSDDISQVEESPYSVEQQNQQSNNYGVMITASRPRFGSNPKVSQSQSQSWQALKFDPFDFSQPEIFNQQKKNLKETRFKNNKDNSGLNETQKEKGMDEITQIRYIRDIGLIASSFNGTLKFFDAFNFKEYWSTNNQTRQKDENSDGEDFTMHDHFTTFDINTKLGLLVTGGVEGRMVLIDPYALGIVKNKRCHQSEILQLYIYAEQQQIISVAMDRSIGLWDSQLKKLEIIKDVTFGEIQASKFTSSSFDQQSGTLYVCCHQINVWQAQVDSKIEINAIQVQTLSKNILEERKFLDWQDPSWKWQQKELKDKGIILKKKDADTKTGRVLVTNASQLVDILSYQANKNQDGDLCSIITVDSENLLRMWELMSSTTTQSYRCPVFGRVTAVAIDKTNQYLAVGSSLGEAVIINMKSGGVLYKLESCKNEITFLRFNELENEFWLFGGCWGGTFQSWSKPREDNKFIVTLRQKLVHQNDLLSIDTSNTLIATGDDKGIVGIWNIFSGQIKFLIEMPFDLEIKNSRRAAIKRIKDSTEHDQHYPNDKAEENQNQSQSVCENVYGLQRDDTLRDFNNLPRENFIKSEAQRDFKKAIVQLQFHPFFLNYIQVMQESGHVHLIEAMNGSIYLKDIAIVQNNSSWACDVENYELFIIGENGQAALFDNSLGAKKFCWLDLVLKQKNNDTANPGGLKAGIQVPGKTIQIPGKNGGKKREVRNEWINLNIQNKPYFQAYDPKHMINNFVVTVKFVKEMKVFISGTSCGQVKIWTNRTCQQLALLNSPDWDPKRLISYINRELEDDDDSF